MRESSTVNELRLTLFLSWFARFYNGLKLFILLIADIDGNLYSSSPGFRSFFIFFYFGGDLLDTYPFMVEPNGRNYCLTLSVDLFTLRVLPNLPVFEELFMVVDFLTGEADALM